ARGGRAPGPPARGGPAPPAPRRPRGGPGGPGTPPVPLLVAGQQSPRYLVGVGDLHADNIPAVEGKADRHDPVLFADVETALVADPDHDQARVRHVVAFSPDNEFGHAPDVGARAQPVVIMDSVV